MVLSGYRSKSRACAFPLLLCLVVCLCLVLPVSAQASDAEKTEYGPTRYGLSLLAGTAYDPDKIGLAIMQGQMLIDYERIVWHSAPESLRLKFEVNAGLTTDGRHRSLLAINMLALRYLERFRSGSWTPYVEAGIGLTNTDFRVEGQGLRLNFNPQAGAGVEYALPGGGALTTALRLHHISNGNIYKNNRGVNSALLMIGYLF